ncbi:MAG: sigma-54-dependent Fis family transcriptional regulator [bacterium]|nr:sigma-54-dependent Fis family transcriptional regulator [bacterium]
MSDSTKFAASVFIIDDDVNLCEWLTFHLDDENRDDAGWWGRSPLMLELHRSVERVAGSNVSVVIDGESGTDKELVARAIHDVAELGSSLQATLLRVLQERRFSRLSGSEEIVSNSRPVAATHQGLMAAVAEGEFREGLFYRLAVFELDLALALAPLRMRRDDIPELSAIFLREMARESGTGILPSLSSDAMRVMVEYDWSGNVRELRSAVRRNFAASGRRRFDMSTCHRESSIRSTGVQRMVGRKISPWSPISTQRPILCKPSESSCARSRGARASRCHSGARAEPGTCRRGRAIPWSRSNHSTIENAENTDSSRHSDLFVHGEMA